MNARLATAGLVLALVAALGCAAKSRVPPPVTSPAPRATAPRDVVHVLRPGENLYRLSLHYDVTVDAIVRANGIRDVSSLSVGTRLRIPRARTAPPEENVALASLIPPGSDLRAKTLREASLAFRWPLRGKLSSRFGPRRRRQHEGIDISVKTGTPVRAAEAGRVIHSGWLGDYGRVVIVKHAGRYSSVYAHNRKNLVRKGAFVEQGQILAEAGSSGNASGPHLHFEIRRDRKPQDPLPYLP